MLELTTIEPALNTTIFWPPTLAPSFSFRSVPNALTCTPVTIEWQYTGPPEQYNLAVAEVDSFKVLPPTSVCKSRRTNLTSNFVAFELNAADLKFTWPLVNVSHGHFYKLQACGNGIQATSAEFFVGLGTNTCLSHPSPLTTIVVTPSPTGIPLMSQAHTTYTGPAAAIAGGLAGATILFAIVGVLLYYLRKRRSSLWVQRAALDMAIPRSALISPDGDKADQHDRNQELKVPPEEALLVPTVMLIAPEFVKTLASNTRSATYLNDASQRNLTQSTVDPNTTADSAAAQAISPSYTPPLLTPVSAHTRKHREIPTALSFYTPPSISLRSSYWSSASRSGRMPITSPAPSSATSRMYCVRDSAWASIRSVHTIARMSASMEFDDDAHTSTVQAQRAVVATGELKALKWPETCVSLSSDLR